MAATKKKKTTTTKPKEPKVICQNKNCDSMGRYLSLKDFYKSRNLSIGRHPFCKDCVDRSVDITDMQTVYDVMQTLDTPFIKDVWIEMLSMEALNEDPEPSYIGSYLKLLNTKYRRYATYRYKDSIFESEYAALEKERAEAEAEKRRQEEERQKEKERLEEEERKRQEEERKERERIEFEKRLQEENMKKILEEEAEKRRKEEASRKWYEDWQGEYTEKEIKYLEDYYTELQKDFKIVTRNHRDYARKIAQASLIMDNAFNRMRENPDDKDAVASYNTATANFDRLSKSAQFAESQRGANDVSLGCFGRVFDAVEKHNFVPQHIPEDKDMIDKIIDQFSNIEKSL